MSTAFLGVLAGYVTESSLRKVEILPYRLGGVQSFMVGR